MNKSISDMSIRPVKFSDCEMLLEWRNDFETRKNSINTYKIGISTHVYFIKNIIDSEIDHIFIFLKNNVPVGQIRCCIGAPCELSWTISPEFRKKGFGKEMLEFFLKEHKNLYFCAIIKPTNKPSIKIAKHCGFKLLNSYKDYDYYERNK